jgi:putative salt-induced outer membrane protein
MWKQASVGLLGLALWGAAYADDAPPASDPGTDSTWASRAQAGYTKTNGNTDTSSANGLFHVAHVIGDWKLLFGAEGLYGSTKGETTAQAWDLHFQDNYNITAKLYWYSGLRYDDNKFSGFAYQALISTGVGYQFIKSDDTQLSGQIGVGARRLRPEFLTEDSLGAITSTSYVDPACTALPLPPNGGCPTVQATTDAVLDAAVNLTHAFNSFTKVIAGVAVESGKDNTMTNASIALQVKMSDRLGLSAGYALVRNSKPPMGVGSSSSLTTLSLVYELKNKNLAPE